MILVIDNYDSFVYNLVQYLGILGQAAKVVRNNQIEISDVERLQPAAIIISPGPCGPREAGISIELVKKFAGRIPILGVCLGHQVIAEAFQAQIRRAGRPMHGKLSPVTHVGTGIFAGISSPFQVCRYHSLVVDEASLPEEFMRTAWADDGELMAIQHVKQDIYGIQFHPESLYTEQGMLILSHFVDRVRYCQGKDVVRLDE